MQKLECFNRGRRWLTLFCFRGDSLAAVINVKKKSLFIPKKSVTIPCKMLEEGVENGHKDEQKSQILLGKKQYMYKMTFELYIQYAPS